MLVFSCFLAVLRLILVVACCVWYCPLRFFGYTPSFSAGVASDCIFDSGRGTGFLCVLKRHKKAGKGRFRLDLAG